MRYLGEVNLPCFKKVANVVLVAGWPEIKTRKASSHAGFSAINGGSGVRRNRTF